MWELLTTNRRSRGSKALIPTETAPETQSFKGGFILLLLQKIVLHIVRRYVTVRFTTGVRSHAAVTTLSHVGMNGFQKTLSIQDRAKSVQIYLNLFKSVDI